MKALFTIFLGVFILPLGFNAAAQSNQKDSIRWYLDRSDSLWTIKNQFQAAYKYTVQAQRISTLELDTLLFVKTQYATFTQEQALRIKNEKFRKKYQLAKRIVLQQPEKFSLYALSSLNQQRIRLYRQGLVDSSLYLLDSAITFAEKHDTEHYYLFIARKLSILSLAHRLEEAAAYKAYLEKEILPTVPEAYKIHFFAVNAHYYTATGDFLAAIEVNKALLANPNYRGSRIDRHEDIGTMSLNIGEYEQALEHYNASLQIKIKGFGAQHPAAAKAYLRLGEVYRQVGEYEKALDYYYQGYLISSNNMGEYTFRVGSFCNNIGETYYGLGQYKEALKWHKKALKIRKKIAYHPYLTNSYDHIGACYTKLGDFQKATQFLQKALEMREKMPKASAYLPYRLKSYLHLAEYHEALGNYHEAIHYYQLGLAANNVNYRNEGMAKYEFLNHIANTQLYLSHIDEALKNYENAFLENVPSYQYGQKTQPKLEECHDLLSLLETLHGKAKALRLKSKLSGNHQDYLQALDNFYWADEVIDLLRKKYTTQKDKVRLGKVIQAFYEDAGELCWELYQETKDKTYWHHLFHFSERSKSGVLAEVQQSRYAKQFAHLPDAVIAKEREYSRLITYYQQKVLAGGAHSAKNQIKLLEAKDAYTRFIKELETNHPEYYALKFERLPISISAIQKSLTKNEVLVEYFIIKNQTIAFVIAQKQFKVKQLGEISVVQVRNFRNGLIQGKWNQYATAAHQLHEILIKPIAEDLTEEKLTIVPDGLIWYINFDLLLSKVSQGFSYQNQAYLLKQHAIRYRYAAQLGLTRKDKALSNTKLLAFAPSYQSLQADSAKLNSIGENFRGEVGELQWNDKEVEQITQTWGGDAYYENAASEKVFKEKFRHGQILHLAMHALLNDQNPEQSRLVFTHTADAQEDDFLNVYELYNMVIEAELAVLSACNTGVGKLEGGEGMMSLGRAFAYAGCPAVVMSQWKVDDRATSLIMEKFYFYLNQGMEKSVALKNAKLAYLKNARSREANPYLWGSFIVVGNNQPLSQPSYKNTYIATSLLVVVLGVGWIWKKKALFS
ncbi:MAG: CHAT domain-containing protein [Flammeovirgaceae bacterium]